MDLYFNEEYFNTYVYKEQYGDYKCIKDDFIEFVGLLKGTDELKYLLYNNKFSKDEILNMPHKFKESSLSQLRKRLKEDGSLNIIKVDGKKEWVTLSDKGLGELNLYISKEFITKNK